MIDFILFFSIYAIMSFSLLALGCYVIRDSREADSTLESLILKCVGFSFLMLSLTLFVIPFNE